MRDQERSGWPIERLLSGVNELGAVLGRDSAPVLDRAHADLVAARADRDAGDREAAVGHIAAAMAELAALGEGLGSVEGALMRGLAMAFVSNLARADREAIEGVVAQIQERAGKPRRQ